MVFSHPPIASCGLTSVAAIERYGEQNIRVQKSAFAGMLCARPPSRRLRHLSSVRHHSPCHPPWPSQVRKCRVTFARYAFNDEGHRGKTMFRIVLKLPEEKVVGLHMLGPAVDEIMQGFAIAIGMGATRVATIVATGRTD